LVCEGAWSAGLWKSKPYRPSDYRRSRRAWSPAFRRAHPLQRDPGGSAPGEEDRASDGHPCRRTPPLARADGCPACGLTPIKTYSRNPSSTNCPASEADQSDREQGGDRVSAAASRLAEAKRIGGELVQASKRADRATADLVAALRRRAELRRLTVTEQNV